MKPLRRSLILVGICLGIIVCWRFLQYGRSSSPKVFERTLVDSPLTLRDVTSGRRPLEPRRWREIVGLDGPYLNLGSAELHWSAGSSSAGNYQYYLYFGKPGQESERFWEFAPCRWRNFTNIGSDDLATQFYGAKSQEAGGKFVTRISNSAVTVYGGEIVFARQTGETNIVYALRIDHQGLGRADGKFVTFDLRKGVQQFQ